MFKFTEPYSNHTHFELARVLLRLIIMNAPAAMMHIRTTGMTVPAIITVASSGWSVSLTAASNTDTWSYDKLDVSLYCLCFNFWLHVTDVSRFYVCYKGIRARLNI